MGRCRIPCGSCRRSRLCALLPRAPAFALISAIWAFVSAGEPGAGVRTVLKSASPTPAGAIIGIQPCARSATRRREAFELPPIQIGIGLRIGFGIAWMPFAVKWRPV